VVIYLIIQFIFSYFHDPFQQSHFKNINAKNLNKQFFIIEYHQKNHFNFNSIKIYLHDFVVPILEYKIFIFILNSFVVTDL